MFDSHIFNTLWNGILIVQKTPHDLFLSTQTIWGVQVINAGAWCLYKKDGIVIAHKNAFIGCNAGGIYVENGGLSVDKSFFIGLGGPGIAAFGSNAHVQNNTMHSAILAGVILLNSPVANILDNTIIETDPPPSGPNMGLLGDGVVAVNSPHVVLDNNLIVNSSRAAVSNFGGHLAIHDSTFRCQGFDIGAEPHNQIPATYDDNGGVLCGCPSLGIPMGPCLAKSYALESPPPVGGLE